MNVVLPSSPEAWAFATVVFGSLAGGVGWLANRWANRKVARETVTLTKEAAMQAELAKAHERLISDAKEREESANARTDKALALNATLTTITTEQMATIKLILDIEANLVALTEEVRRGNGNYEALVRELSYRPRG